MDTTILTNTIAFEELLPDGYIKTISDFLGYSLDFVRKVLRGERQNKYILIAAVTLAAKNHKTKVDLDNLMQLVIDDISMSKAESVPELADKP